MKHYKITFSDGNVIHTEMNIPLEEAREYYTGKYFNFGDNDNHPKDKMIKAVSVEEI